jgi:hypothetical protein
MGKPGWRLGSRELFADFVVVIFLITFYTLTMSSLLKSRHGVSGLEYLALAVLLMTGILLGGPYVMRAINAPFKAIEEGGIDSTREEIRQGNEHPVTAQPCACTGFVAQGCGDGIGCARTKRLYTRTCDPMGCEVDLIAAGVITQMQDCVDESPSVCCLPAQSTGNCGALASHIPGGCPVGHMEVKKMCGSPTPTAVYSCVVDPSCLNACQPLGANAQGWCDPVHYNDNVVGSMPPVMVNNGECGSTLEVKCVAECKVNFYKSASSCLPYCLGQGHQYTCKDGNCFAPIETQANCPEDCTGPPPPVCNNDGVCGGGEDNSNCAADCYCGNLTCDIGESWPGCADCPEPPGGG